jgi:hypothetical protein
VNLTYRRLTGFHGVIILHSNSVGALGQVSIVSHSYQVYFGFLESDLNLNCGLHDYVITRFASVGIKARLRNKLISFYYFCFFNVPLSFSMLASFIFLFFVSATSKQKNKLYFILLLSLIILVT